MGPAKKELGGMMYSNIVDEPCVYTGPSPPSPPPPPSPARSLGVFPARYSTACSSKSLVRGKA
eukprot:7322727-Pyramimonas_sp.AAC.1